MNNLEILESNLRKLEDIKNSTESLVEKVGHLQVDLFNNPDKDLEKFLEKLNGIFSDAHQEITHKNEEYENSVVVPNRSA